MLAAVQRYCFFRQAVPYKPCTDLILTEKGNIFAFETIPENADDSVRPPNTSWASGGIRVKSVPV